MDDGSSPVSILILIGLILLEAAFYGFGAAIQNVNSSKLEDDMEKGSKKAAQLLRIVNRPTSFVNTIQITTSIIGMFTGAWILRVLVTDIFGHLDAWGQVIWWQNLVITLAVAVVLVVFMVSLGIIIPKRLAAGDPEGWGYRLLPFVRLVMTLFWPLTRLITGLCHVVLKLLGVDMSPESENVTEEDIMSMVNEGHEQGILEAGETEMITNIFQLGEKAAWDIMTHRTNVVAFEGATPLKEVVDFLLTQGTNTRYPVYGEDMDDIIGTLHFRDAIVFYEKKDYDNWLIKDIPGLLREPVFIPETRSIDTLFKDMQSRKIHMVIVVDEYGQTAGVLTMEDILEEIVGNIVDEYDQEEDTILEQENHTYLMKGMALLEDVMDVLDIKFSQEDYDTYDTLNGFLISRLDRIPQEDERPVIDYGGYRFQVLKVGNKMIELVRVSPLPKEEEGKQEDTFPLATEEKT